MKLMINSSQIKKEYTNSYLISIPNTRGHHFYLSKKCCYPRGWFATIYLNEEYTYHCVSGAKLKNKFELTGEELIDKLENVNKQVSVDADTGTQVLLHNVPEKKEVEEVTIVDELKR